VKPAHLPDHAGDLRRRLVDVRAICERLGLAEGAQHQTGGLKIKCPWHPERTASCSIRLASDGTIAVNCFGCSATGDVFHLVAVVNGIDVERDFPRVLELAAELAGADLEDRPQARRAPVAPPAPARSYPPAAEVAALWSACKPATDDDEASGWLRSRGLEPADVETFDLARALAADVVLPPWARSRWGTWSESGHRCIVPMFDDAGELRSLRARRIVEADSPKALPPCGYTVGGIVMACTLGRQILAAGKMPDFWPSTVPLKIVVAEGEPDFFAWATRWADSELTAPAVLGIVAGAWTPTIAARIPAGARVTIWTHADVPGEKYASVIIESLRGRCTLLRGGVAS
jgi:CHC2 zinc finger